MASPSPPQTARSIGILFNDTILQGKQIYHCAPGDTNSILDVAPVRVGHANFKGGSYYVNNGQQSFPTTLPTTVNSGVTAILPLGFGASNARKRRSSGNEGNEFNTYVPAGFFSLNGCGEMTGIHWVEESGLLQGPIMLTNTVSVGDVRKAVIKYWYDAQNPSSDLNLDAAPLLPVVAETDDSWLNDIMNPVSDNAVDFGQAATDAISSAISASDTSSIPLAQGNVGGGTGMTCYSWKGGIGTSSRVVQLNKVSVPSNTDPTKSTNTFTVGVLVQANQGIWNELTILGAPVGPIERFEPATPADDFCECGVPPTGAARQGSPKSVRPSANTLKSAAGKPKIARGKRKSSIIVVIATDAPLFPHQLKRLARRGALGIARTGTSSHDDSGELCIAFSTANQDGFNGYEQTGKIATDMFLLPNETISPCLFTAAVEATEEAILNALIAAEDLSYVTNTGCAIAGPATLPSLTDLLQKYHRMT